MTPHASGRYAGAAELARRLAAGLAVLLAAAAVVVALGTLAELAAAHRGQPAPAATPAPTAAQGS